MAALIGRLGDNLISGIEFMVSDLFEISVLHWLVAGLGSSLQNVSRMTGKVFLSGFPRSPDPERWVEAYGDYLFKYALMRLRDSDKPTGKCVVHVAGE